MKKLITYIGLLWVVSLSSCIKDQLLNPKGHTPPTKVLSIMPDSTGFNIRCISTTTSNWVDEDAIYFVRASSALYFGTEDAPRFPGYGTVAMAAISADNIKLSDDELPYTEGVTIPLWLSISQPGNYNILISHYYGSIPTDIHVWCKDNISKDSVDLRIINKQFTVTSEDTSYRNRFSIKVSH